MGRVVWCLGTGGGFSHALQSVGHLLCSMTYSLSRFLIRAGSGGAWTHHNVTTITTTHGRCHRHNPSLSTARRMKEMPINELQAYNTHIE